MNGFHYPDRPAVGVGVVVWRGDRLLLVRRAHPPMQGEWGLPGGKQQLGETMRDAAAREVREESGVEIAPCGVITALDVVTRDAADRIEFHYTIIEIAADWVSGEGVAGDDAREVRWVTLAELDALGAWSEIARVARLSLDLK